MEIVKVMPEYGSVMKPITTNRLEIPNRIVIDSSRKLGIRLTAQKAATSANVLSRALYVRSRYVTGY
jgi:hypothetical protein